MFKLSMETQKRKQSEAESKADLKQKPNRMQGHRKKYSMVDSKVKKMLSSIDHEAFKSSIFDGAPHSSIASVVIAATDKEQEVMLYSKISDVRKRARNLNKYKKKTYKAIGALNPELLLGHDQSSLMKVNDQLQESLRSTRNISSIEQSNRTTIIDDNKNERQTPGQLPSEALRPHVSSTID